MTRSSRAVAVNRIAANAPLHPVMFALFPVLFLIVNNHPEFSWLQVARSLVLSVLLAVLLIGLGRVGLPNRRAAALLASTIILTLFSYGHIYGLTEDVAVGGVVIGRHRHLLPLIVAVIALASIRISSLSTRSLQGLTLSANTVGIIAVAVQVGTLLYHTIPLGEDISAPSTLESKAIGAPPQPSPDIYYIILDGYGRQDILEEIYGFDNSSFVDWLDEQGFYVADRSYANYLHTDISLATALNMDYLHALQQHYGFTSETMRVEKLISGSEVRSQLESTGYRMVAFSTGFWPTDVGDADVYIEVGQRTEFPLALFAAPGLNRYESLLLETTAYRAVVDLKERLGIQDNPFERTYAHERERVHTIFSTLAKIPTWPDRYFVFAHIIPPHPPFIFGSSGEPLSPSYPYNLADHADFLKYGTREEYMEGYIGQLRYMNYLLERTIAEIIEASSTAPIIIIQGDHGPGAYYRYGSLEGTYLPERSSILNAYLVPDRVRTQLYPSITPVNSFRLILTHAFGADLELLPDQTYFNVNSEEAALDFVPVENTWDPDD